MFCFKFTDSEWRGSVSVQLRLLLSLRTSPSFSSHLTKLCLSKQFQDIPFARKTHWSSWPLRPPILLRRFDSRVCKFQCGEISLLVWASEKMPCYVAWELHPALWQKFRRLRLSRTYKTPIWNNFFARCPAHPSPLITAQEIIPERIYSTTSIFQIST
jgi:hypothetical protein